jgi:hypothetical protein
MPTPTPEPRYRLVVFDPIDIETEAPAVRDLFCQVTGLHAADAMLWIAKAPGAWPHALSESQTRALLDGLYELRVAAEAWLVDKFPDLNPIRTIHDAACLSEGFRVKGLRGEPTHWVPWDKIELICAGRIEAEDEFRAVRPPNWPSAARAAFRAVTLRNPHPFERKSRAMRVPRDPVGELILIRKDPRVAFRVIESQMNYAYLGERLSPSAAVNFPILLAEIVARADQAHLTPSTRAFLKHDDPSEYTFPSANALAEYANLRLLWSWYKRDRDDALDHPGTEAESR